MALTTKEWLKILPLYIRKKIIMSDYDIIKNKLDLQYLFMSDMINELCFWDESHDPDFYNKLYNYYRNKEQHYENNERILNCLTRDLKKDVALLYKSLSIKPL